MEEFNIRAMLDVENLVLDYMGIRKLDAHMNDLAALPLLTSLDLHGNDLTDLPSDMSCLRHLRRLHLEDNAFT
jgi:Leucine-rich repeat (LRR) protein